LALVILVAGSGLAVASNGGVQVPGGAQGSAGTQVRGGASRNSLHRGAVRETGLQMIQHVLGLRADGAWGPQTEHALRHFQAVHGLAVTGVSSAATLTAMGLDPAYQPPLPPLTAPAADAIRGPASAVRAELHKIARCESGNDVHQLSDGGLYRGRYQFDMESWYRAGGLGDPAQAPADEQYRRAAWILATQGRSAAWPVCS